jgi:hypothetical protein
MMGMCGSGPADAGFAHSPPAFETEQLKHVVFSRTMNRFARPHCFADMYRTHSTKYLLESLVDGESLDRVLTSLIVIAEKKAQSQYSNKVTVNQWSRAARRLKELRAWCAKFGPGSDCR